MRIEIAVEAGDWPAENELETLSRDAVMAAVRALAPLEQEGGRAGADPPPLRGEIEKELSLLFTDDAHIRRLNAQWRGKDAPTNVLSFPQDSAQLLGDVILAAETVRDEAALAGKPVTAHMAHLIIHGFLHLLGFDHETEAEAEEMEALERAALGLIGIADPYAVP